LSFIYFDGRGGREIQAIGGWPHSHPLTFATIRIHQYIDLEEEGCSQGPRKKFEKSSIILREIGKLGNII
jgi:hypothetical protein